MIREVLSVSNFVSGSKLSTKISKQIHRIGNLARKIFAICNEIHCMGG